MRFYYLKFLSSTLSQNKVVINPSFTDQAADYALAFAPVIIMLIGVIYFCTSGKNVTKVWYEREILSMFITCIIGSAVGGVGVWVIHWVLNIPL